jgi:IS30 family transposase
LNQVLLSYLSDEPPARRAKRPALSRQHSIARRLRAQTVHQMAAEYEAGASAAEVSQRYGVAKSTVLRLLRQASVPVRFPRLSSADADRIADMYVRGMPQTEIAKAVKRSPSAVWHVLRRQGHL